MLRLPALPVIVGSLLAFAPIPALAHVCYMVLDKSDAAVYRDQVPPVDMSSAGTEARDKMRQRGELLIIMDTDKCQQILPVRVGTVALTADQVLSDAPRMQTSVPGAQASRPVVSGGVTAPMPAPASSGPAAAPAPAAAGVRGGGGGMRY